MEKLKVLSKPASHAPAAEAWAVGTHFPPLEVSNGFPVSDLPQNSNSRLLAPPKHTEQFWGVHRSFQSLVCTRAKQEPPKPQGVGSKCRVHREGAHKSTQRRSAWDAENKDQQFCSLSTWWDSSGCWDSIWEPNWLNGDQATEDSVLTTQNY